MRIINYFLLLVSAYFCSVDFALSVEPSWKFVGESEQATYYFDANNISRKGEFVSIWNLIDYKNRLDIGAMSIKALEQIDCFNNMSKTLMIISFEDRFASGKILNYRDHTNDGSSSIIVPGSAQDSLKEIACGYKPRN